MKIYQKFASVAKLLKFKDVWRGLEAYFLRGPAEATACFCFVLVVIMRRVVCPGLPALFKAGTELTGFCLACLSASILRYSSMARSREGTSTSRSTCRQNGTHLGQRWSVTRGHKATSRFHVRFPRTRALRRGRKTSLAVFSAVLTAVYIQRTKGTENLMGREWVWGLP